jgi:hypothetical protein
MMGREMHADLGTAIGDKSATLYSRGT